MGEKVIRDACGSKEGDLLTIAVAPHQVSISPPLFLIPLFLCQFDTYGNLHFRFMDHVMAYFSRAF